MDFHACFSWYFFAQGVSRFSRMRIFLLYNNKEYLPGHFGEKATATKAKLLSIVKYRMSTVAGY